MTTLYRVRKGGLWGTSSILQRLDETDGAEWRDVRYSPQIGLFAVVRIRYWQQVEAKLALQRDQADARKAQREKKRRSTDFHTEDFTTTRMPKP